MWIGEPSKTKIKLKDGHHQPARHEDGSHFNGTVVELRLRIKRERCLKDREPELSEERQTEQRG